MTFCTFLSSHLSWWLGSTFKGLEICKRLVFYHLAREKRTKVSNSLLFVRLYVSLLLNDLKQALQDKKETKGKVGLRDESYAWYQKLSVSSNSKT